MESLNGLKTINYDEKEGYAIFSLNPKIYPLEIVYSAAYIMIDKMFVILDGDPSSEILVEIRKKDPKQDMMALVKDFNDELLNYAVYKQQSEKNKLMRETLLQRILLTNNPDYFNVMSKQQCACNEKIDDPEDIMKTWEEANPKEAEKLKREENARKC